MSNLSDFRTYQARGDKLCAIQSFLMNLFKRKKPRTAAEIAGIIERFLDGNSLYPQEWNDFVECRERDASLDSYRRKCYELDPMVNSPYPTKSKSASAIEKND